MKKLFLFRTRQIQKATVLLTGALLLSGLRANSAVVEGISESALQQIAALQAEKESRTPAQLKMDSQLVYALKQGRGETIAVGVSNLVINVQADGKGRVLVDLDATVNGAVLEGIAQAGGSIQFSSVQFKSIRALVPLNQLEFLAGLPDVRFIQPAVQARTRTGSVDSEGDTTHRAITARPHFNVTGAGVKVGVLSDSVDFLSQSQATGDTPPDVVVLPGQAGVGAGEGTAMLEIVYDVSPGSKLYFASAFNGVASFAQNIINLRAAGCDIIVDDVFYFNESPFQDGPIARAVNQVTADGALYFSSAGNEGNLDKGTSGTWQGDFVDAGTVSSPVNGRGGNVHSFGATAYDTVLQPGFASVLFWSDPLGASTNDYDLYVLDSTGANVVNASTTVQNGTQDPYEIAQPTAPNQRLVVVKVSGDPRFLHIDTFRGQLSIGTEGNTKGHCVATNAYCVAAVDVATAFPNPFTGGSANPVEFFSSDGPRRVFYQADGTPITAGNFLSTGGALRLKPDIAAADGVTTTVPGFAPFFGTSAAAPHAAAIAALLKSYNPQLLPDQIRSLIAATSLDIEAPGFDRDSGSGIIMAYQLLQAAPAGLNLLVSTNYLPGGNGNGVIDPDECNTMFLVVSNLGGIGITNIHATLTTTNDHVIVTGRTSLYPDLPPGVGGTNLVAFQFSTSPTFVCGSQVNFALVLKSDQATITNYFSLPSGFAGAPIRYDSTGPVPIPDLSTADSPIVVSNFSSAVLGAYITVYIQHTYDSDLLLELISPAGITNVLATNVGGSGDNFGGGCADNLRTVFTDGASLGIRSGAPPFIGPFKPEQPFSVYIGMTGTNVNGTWHLHVLDQVALDFGSINCWSLFLTPPSCTDGGGECPGSDLAIGGNAAPEPLIVGGNLVYSLSITNLGPKTAKGVTLTQILPPSVVVINYNISQGSISQSGGTINGNIGNMAVGTVVTATITVLPTQAGILTTTASTAALADPDFDLSNNSITLTSHVNPPTADVAVGLTAAPNPVLVGGTLTYTITATNKGPSTASNVVISNALATTVAITSATPSQGFATILANAVIFNLGTLNPGAVATATITVIPSAQGQVTATATIGATQFDPVSANNTASVTTSVSPSADLAIGFQSVPASIVLGNNLNYTVVATNLGPSTASSVFISQILPTNALVITSNSTAGTLSQSGNVISCDVGSMPLGGTVTMTVLVSIPTAGTATSSVNISGGLTDPVPANNSASVNTLVALPFVSVQPAGATLTAESFAPPNGSVDPGETVTVQLRLANLGNVSTTNLMAKLLTAGGVTSPNANTVIYGPLAPGGLPVSKSFSFTASGTNGGSIVATLQLSGDVSNTVSFTFQLPKVATFANTNVIVIPDIGSASPYPSTINVSGVTGVVGHVTATLTNFNHTYPNDVSVLLVAPSGAKSLLMAHAASLGSAAIGATFTFDDSAAAPLPDTGTIGSGTWQPSAYPPAPVFTNPAPAGPYNAAMSVFNSGNPNGTWSLFVIDDSAGDSGGISNGWSLAITTINPVNQTADLSLAGAGSANPVLAGDTLTYTFTVTNNGTNTANSVAFTNTLPANVLYVSAAVSQGSVNTNAGRVIANLGSLVVGASATVTIVVAPTTSGLLSSTATVFANEIDLIPGNNTATVSTTVNLPVADVSIAKSVSTGTVVTGSNFVYTISVANNGPGTALNVVVTDPFPAGVGFVSSSIGIFASGTLTCNLGNLASGSSTTINVNAHAVTAGSVTNTATASTTSTDSNPANNSASVGTVIRPPSAKIGAVNATLVAESFLPKDGSVDPGETVTVSLSLANTGEIDTANLVATLVNTGGVTASSGSSSYGAVIHNGAAVSRSFTFTASSAASGVVTATLSLQDGANNLGTVAFTFLLPQTNSFANTNAIIIPDHGNAAPYPATITVAGLTGLVGKVAVTLNGVTHSFPKDIGILLVSPAGRKSVVMSGVGGGSSITNLTLTFDDDAAASLSDTAAIVAGTYKPTSYPSSRTFPSPAPTGAVVPLFSQLNGTDPNGTWSLYVVDGAAGDAGSIGAGWSITLLTVNPVSPTADLTIVASSSPSSVYVGRNMTYTLFVTNNGPSTATGVVITNLLPAGASLGPVVPSKGTFTTNLTSVLCSLGNLSAGEVASVTITANPGAAGPATDRAFVAANETDLNPADNSASTTVSVLAIVPAHLTGVVVQANRQYQLTLAGQPNLSYIVLASTNLTLNASAWKPISTNTAASNGVFQFTDTNAPGLPQRFYRTIVAP